MSSLHETMPSIGSGVKPSAGRLAEIKPVPPSEAGRVLTSFNICVATGLTLLPIGTGLVGGLGGLGLAAYLSGKDPLVAGLVAAGGVACGVLSVLVLLRYQQFLPSRYLQCVARRSFARRTNPLVRFENSDALFVDIVPRSNWGRTMMEPATDTGLFGINDSTRELLFEGDSKRYRIPFDAVTGCNVEAIRLDADEWGNDLYFATVLSFETATGPREVPLAGRHIEFSKRRMPQRRAQAEELCARIQQAIGS